MNRIVEITTMALGGVSLFMVAFLGFAALAGVPLHDVAVIGKLFPEPEQAEPTGSPTGGTPPVERTEPEIVANSLGVLSTWSLQSPFSSAELKSLADELKLKSLQLDTRLKQVTKREEEADMRQEDLADQFQTFEELRAELDAFEQELILRAQEVTRDETAAAELRAMKWSNLASLFENQDTKNAGPRLMAYTAEEAAKILRALDESKAVEILNTLKGDVYLEYSEAWAAASPSGE